MDVGLEGEHRELRRKDSKTAFLFGSTEGRESFPLARAPQRFFFLPSNGGSQRVIEGSIVLPRKEGQGQGIEGGKKKSVCKRISGSFLCKVTALAYLVGCVLVSALYVALYGGQSQKLFAASDAWIPGKPTQPPPKHHPPSIPPPLHFVDAPYTEWMSQRWTYYGENFSDWPSLPPFIDRIQQVSSGKVDGTEGVWFLTDSSLYFALNLDGGDPGRVQFVNVTSSLELEISPGSRLAVDAGGRVYVATPTNVTLLNCGQGTKDLCSITAQLSDESPVDWNMVIALVVSISDGQLWIGTDTGLFAAELYGDEIIANNITSVEGEVTNLAWRASLTSKQPHSSSKHAFLVTPEGSHLPRERLTHSGSSGVHHVAAAPLRGGYRGSFGLLVAGTEMRVYFFDGVRWWFEWASAWYYGQGGLVDGPPSTIGFASTGDLFIGNNISLTRVNINYTFDRLGPLQGLPYNQLQSLHYSSHVPQNPPPLMRSRSDYTASSEGTLWVGTAKGFALLDVTSSQFEGYFYGNRWHPGEAVLGFAASGRNATVVLTDGGMAVVYPQLWTLGEKAAHYQAMLERHTRPPGLVSDCPLTDYVPSTCTPSPGSNDGLWTSLLVGAESFRYHVTKDPAAWSNAWSLFRGMQFLNNVTGVRGLMARSAVMENVTVGSGEWHNSTSEPGWKWLGDTSSDEVVGHMFAYPLTYDLVAATPEEKSQVKLLVDSIVGYIHNNSYYLIDITNHSTRWGVWNPQPLNFNYSWSDEHGLNSLQMVTYLLSAYRITSLAEYLEAWKVLADDNGEFEGLPTHYGLNLINQKITFPRDDNYSDDELAFLPYFTYFYTMKKLSRQLSALEDQILQYVTLSLQRAWQVASRERSALWTTIYAYAMDLAKDPGLMEDVVWNLRTWPLELVQWQTTNSHRLDITFNPEQDRNFQSHTQSVNVLPANERTQLRWNGNPYQLDYGGSDDEMDPGAWLLPYWMARWIGML